MTKTCNICRKIKELYERNKDTNQPWKTVEHITVYEAETYFIENEDDSRNCDDNIALRITLMRQTR